MCALSERGKLSCITFHFRIKPLLQIQIDVLSVLQKAILYRMVQILSSLSFASSLGERT